MKKIKVLFLINTLTGGGAEKVLVNIVNNINKDKFDVTVQTLYNKGLYIDNIAHLVKYRTIVKNPDSFLGKQKARVINKIIIKCNSKLLHKLFIHKKYDCEIGFLEGIPTKIISGANNKTSKISWIHVDLANNIESEYYFKDYEECKKTYERFDKIIGVSKVVVDQIIKKYDLNSDKCLIRYNPIDCEEIINKSKEKIEEKLEKKDFLICSIGRYTEQKAFDRLINIHKKLLDKGIKNTLWLIGEGHKKNELEEQIQELKVEKTCKLLGFKKNPYKYLKQADLFVCSSLAEGFSTVACEATILGIPIVTTMCAGMEELLGSNNEYGIITENNEDALYLGVERILNDKNLYNSYKGRIKERAEIFNLTNSTQQIEKILEDTINEKNFNNSK